MAERQNNFGTGFHEVASRLEVGLDQIESGDEWDDPTFDDVAAKLEERREPPRIPFGVLTPRQVFVVERLWGLNGHDAYTERELADAMKISQQAVHNLEARALEAMRRHLEGVVT